MEDYVTFDQAVKLKELGFDWKVRACYRQKLILDEDSHQYTEPKFVHNDTMRKRWTSNYNDNRCGVGTGIRFFSAPTIAQAQKWLREVKGIDAIVLRYADDYDYKVYSKNMVSVTEELFETYEQALSAGIDEGLELLK